MESAGPGLNALSETSAVDKTMQFGTDDSDAAVELSLFFFKHFVR